MSLNLSPEIYNAIISSEFFIHRRQYQPSRSRLQKLKKVLFQEKDYNKLENPLCEPDTMGIKDNE